ncbi:hypothetical protein DAEQUDRAFT_760599 [Daedalea quercina L-15889]|uniref:Uncharacterized protein n=1 Tax=Daedalea quercina L-15889 TaxID=1314783 RepID=A0A165KIV6_9APHY|nr:hypothetical protein DAEQUDRAFT_760599 [Daedalea quercina L-15889]
MSVRVRNMVHLRVRRPKVDGRGRSGSIRGDRLCGRVGNVAPHTGRDGGGPQMPGMIVLPVFLTQHYAQDYARAIIGCRTACAFPVEAARSPVESERAAAAIALATGPGSESMAAYGQRTEAVIGPGSAAHAETIATAAGATTEWASESGVAAEAEEEEVG